MRPSGTEPKIKIYTSVVGKNKCEVKEKSETFRENLVYNKEEVSDKKLDEVCKAVGLEHFISILPNGYDTVLDESISLSEGQKQQLTIARARLKMHHC